jgi:hypothetical protein
LGLIVLAGSPVTILHVLEIDVSKGYPMPGLRPII